MRVHYGAESVRTGCLDTTRIPNDPMAKQRNEQRTVATAPIDALTHVGANPAAVAPALAKATENHRKVRDCGAHQRRYLELQRDLLVSHREEELSNAA
jgi:hypothetical protein